MKYAVIGKGFIFPRHKEAIEKTGGEIVMTCDIDESKNPDFTDWVEMYNSPRFKEVDTVVICAPNYLHPAMAREATLLNKRVLCEKPLSINGTVGLYGVNTVLQLRYHPALQNLKPKYVLVTAKMFRDESYWKSWKGDQVKSGGILYNLGVHYIDLLIFLLGIPKYVCKAEVSEKLAIGRVQFENGIGEFHIEILDTRKDQERKIFVNDKEVSLSDKDNLSYEDLHIQVYKNFLKGKGISFGEEKKSLDLIADILKCALKIKEEQTWNV